MALINLNIQNLTILLKGCLKNLNHKNIDTYIGTMIENSNNAVNISI